MSTPPRAPGLKWKALGSAMGLGAWFFLAYGFCNWWTSRRTEVGTFFWDWERHLPFVPEFIVPYMSIDLFFVGGFFLCRSAHELRVMNQRIFTDITASAVLFLLFPLQLGVPRPTPAGWTAPVFAFLHMGDLPYNLAPSLHISLRALLWITYGRHLRGAWRSVTKVWFLLIGLSTLLTWQHHVFDVATGFVMAWAVVAAIPDREVQPGPVYWLGLRTRRHRTLAIRYGSGALACAAMIFLPHAGWFMIWPALALGITSLAYATANPRFFQKSSGNLSPAAEWTLLPVRLTAEFWQRRWMRREPAWTPISPNVWFGRKPAARDAAALLGHGCVACVDLTAESNFPVMLRERVAYLNAPVLDLTPPSREVLQEVLGFIAEHQRGGMVLVHCQLGLGRSALVAAAWLLHRGHSVTPDDAMRQISKMRPGVVFASVEAAELLSGIQPPRHT